MWSYSRGHDAPLIEASTWDVFRKTASRFPDREALVSRHQRGETYLFRTGCNGGADGKRAGGPGPWPKRPDWGVVDELRRVGTTASGMCADRRRAGECESRVPVVRFSLRFAKVEDEGAVSVGERPAVRLSRGGGRSDGRADAGTRAPGLLWHGRLDQDVVGGARHSGSPDIGR